jgi:hypothetical protein
MVALRSARLEALLGSRLELVQHADLLALVSDHVPEAFDLDFKSEMYGPADRDKRDAATDIAALANTAGGLLVLGIEEDKQARATAAPGLELSESDERRIRQIVGSQIVPMPVIDVLRVEDPGWPWRGPDRRTAEPAGSARGCGQRWTAVSEAQQRHDEVPVRARGGRRLPGTVRSAAPPG